MSGPGVGFEYPEVEVSWQKRDLLLFANSIGCKADELHLFGPSCTTKNNSQTFRTAAAVCLPTSCPSLMRSPPLMASARLNAAAQYPLPATAQQCVLRTRSFASMRKASAAPSLRESSA